MVIHIGKIAVCCYEMCVKLLYIIFMSADHVGFDVVVECAHALREEETSMLASASARFRPRQVQFSMGTLYEQIYTMHACICA